MIFIRSHSRSKYSFNIFCAPGLCVSLGPSSRSFLNAKWRTKENLVEWQTKDPKIQVLDWQDLFSAALDLLQVCEREWNTAEEGVRESIQIRLEYFIAALQQVLPFVSINSKVLNEIQGNIRLLHGQWYNTTYQTAQTLQCFL